MPSAQLVWSVAVSTALFLALLGGIAARTGGAKVMTGAGRVLFWGVLAMSATYLVGSLFGVSTA
jgi:VIT1/CCC1 family predicted Fe2+/Mn2+ transporter